MSKAVAKQLSAGKDSGTAMKKNWKIKTIGDVCKVIAGQSPEGKFYNAEGKGMPFYQGKKDFGDKFIEAPTTWTTQTTKIAKEGDILMSVRAPVGPVNFATDEVCIGRGLAAIRSSDELDRDFLFYQLWHLQPDIAGREGAVFASINKAEIEALPLAFAPLPEQQRIVAILDEAFEGIDLGTPLTFTVGNTHLFRPATFGMQTILSLNTHKLTAKLAWLRVSSGQKEPSA